jgi:superfamily II DNA or RNA helicase
MESNEMEVSLLRRLDERDLRRLIGTSIVNAVRSSYNTNIEAILAELLILKHGDALFDIRDLRASLVDLADEDKILSLARTLGFDDLSYMHAASRIRNYFSSGYSEEKSRIFIDWLELPKRYYKRTITDARSYVERIVVRHGESVKLRSYLHPYQKDMKDQILSSLKSPGARLMVQMPTGSGKTYTALETAVDILRRPYQSNFVVWLVNSNELAEQALQSFKDLWTVKGDREIEVYRMFKDFFPDFISCKEGGIVFTSYDLFHSVLKRIDDRRRDSLLYLVKNTEYLIVDEAHSAIADTYEECVRAFINNDNTQIVGLSATPLRENIEETQALVKLFSNNLILVRDEKRNILTDPIKYLQSQGYLAHVVTEILDSGIVAQGNNENAVLCTLAESSERNELIIRQIEYANSISDKTLVFACTLDHVLALYIMCKSRNIRANFIIGDTPQSERPKILADFNSGNTNVLINLDILSTGIDLPNVNRLIITRPVRSSVQYSQIVGRALRGPKNGGNQQNTIINILDNINYFSGIHLLYSSFSHSWE